MNKGHDPLRFASAHAAVLRQFSCRVADMPRGNNISGTHSCDRETVTGPRVVSMAIGAE